MKTLLLVGSGSFIGGVLRYILANAVQWKGTGIPFGILFVNVIGCLIAGVLFGLNEKMSINSQLLLFLLTGFCGGFTTFSAFSVDTFSLLKDGMYFYAFLSIALNIFICLFAVYLGYMIINRLF